MSRSRSADKWGQRNDQRCVAADSGCGLLAVLLRHARHAPQGQHLPLSRPTPERLGFKQTWGYGFEKTFADASKLPSFLFKGQRCQLGSSRSPTSQLPEESTLEDGVETPPVITSPETTMPCAICWGRSQEHPDLKDSYKLQPPLSVEDTSREYSELSTSFRMLGLSRRPGWE